MFSDKNILAEMPSVRIELTTFRLWDWRAAYCANEALQRAKNLILIYNLLTGVKQVLYYMDLKSLLTNFFEYLFESNISIENCYFQNNHSNTLSQ